MAWASPPDLSADEQDELFLLARHFGMSAYEARCVRPAWEIDMLVEGLMREAREAGDGE